MNKKLNEKELDTRKKVGDVMRLLFNGFPACFTQENSQRKPLKKGIYKDIIAWAEESMPDLPFGHHWFAKALCFYTRNGAYLKMIKGSVGKPRYDLQGNESGVITSDEADYAKSVLKERRKKQKAPQSEEVIKKS